MLNESFVRARILDFFLLFFSLVSSIDFLDCEHSKFEFQSSLNCRRSRSLALISIPLLSLLLISFIFRIIFFRIFFFSRIRRIVYAQHSKLFDTDKKAIRITNRERMEEQNSRTVKMEDSVSHKS